MKEIKDVPAEQVQHMAMLSRLLIDKEEEKLFGHQFGQILNHMEVLQSVNTENVEPLFSPLSENALTRPDIGKNIRDRDQILSNAPETDGEAFIVPRIV